MSVYGDVIEPITGEFQSDKWSGIVGISHREGALRIGFFGPQSLREKLRTGLTGTLNGEAVRVTKITSEDAGSLKSWTLCLEYAPEPEEAE